MSDFRQYFLIWDGLTCPEVVTIRPTVEERVLQECTDLCMSRLNVSSLTFLTLVLIVRTTNLVRPSVRTVRASNSKTKLHGQNLYRTFYRAKVCGVPISAEPKNVRRTAAQYVGTGLT